MGIYQLLLFIQAQSIWNGREKSNSINFEINKPITPSYKTAGFTVPGLNAWSGSYFISGRYSLKSSSNITFIADIPIVHGYIDKSKNPDNSEWVFGNPYIGAEFDVQDMPIYFEIGLRLPPAPYHKSLAEYTGALSDFDRSEAFLTHRVPVYGAVNYETVSDINILFSARGGLNLWFNNFQYSLVSNPEVLVDYEFQTGYITKDLNIILSLAGRENLTTNFAETKNASVIQYGMSIIVPYKKIRPALSFRFPGNKPANRLLNFVIGFNLGYVFE